MNSNLKIGKFKPVKVFKADVDCSDDLKEFFVNLGKQVITENQYFEIGMVHALENALDKKTKKAK